MTLATMRTEFKARGFDHVSDARANSFLNQAYTQLAEALDWPFLETTASGPAPLTITDLRAVLYVYDSTNKQMLGGFDNSMLADVSSGDLTTVGTPSSYWIDGTTVVKVQPPNSGVTLSVR